MNDASLKKLLQSVAAGATSPNDAYRELRDLPYEDIGFAKVDHHREIRCGAPEAIFCQGKTTEQTVRIARHMVERTEKMLATRASPEVAAALVEAFPDAERCDAARTVAIRRVSGKRPPGRVLVVCAGTADIPVAEEARVTVEFLDNDSETMYDVGVAGIHRLLAQERRLREANVVIVAAGMEGALASVVGGMIARPVIAVPTSVGYGAGFGGIAALLAMLNSCAPGVSVVNIDNGFGAACVASLINHGNPALRA